MCAIRSNGNLAAPCPCGGHGEKEPLKMARGMRCWVLTGLSSNEPFVTQLWTWQLAKLLMVAPHLPPRDAAWERFG